MPGNSSLAPLGASTSSTAIDAGTLALTNSPTPGTVGAATGGATAAAAAETETDPDIEALDLKGKAKTGAYALKKAHPSVTFTSGRREKEDQARAMAGNVVEERDWIKKTYKQSKIRDACQKWVDDNPDKTTKDDIKAGLLSVFNDHTDDEVAKISKHLSGEAFDVQPVETDADAIKKSIRDLDGCEFLEKEGGLVRWHAQF